MIIFLSIYIIHIIPYSHTQDYVNQSSYTPTASHLQHNPIILANLPPKECKHSSDVRSFICSEAFLFEFSRSTVISFNFFAPTQCKCLLCENRQIRLAKGSLIALPTLTPVPSDPQYCLAIVSDRYAKPHHQIVVDVYVHEGVGRARAVTRVVGCGYTPAAVFGEGVLYRFRDLDQIRALSVATPVIRDRLLNECRLSTHVR